MEYHKQYKNIKPGVIYIIKTILKKKYNLRYYKRDNDGKMFILNEVLKRLCELYNIASENKPTLKIKKNTYGYYSPINNTIALSEKLSLITFLHEFKHFLQHINNKSNT